MLLSVGARLDQYDVTALIGEGGMGQVYQATDTKLNRQVALKILPEAFATDPGRIARFIEGPTLADRTISNRRTSRLVAGPCWTRSEGPRHRQPTAGRKSPATTAANNDAAPRNDDAAR